MKIILYPIFFMVTGLGLAQSSLINCLNIPKKEIDKLNKNWKNQLIEKGLANNSMEVNFTHIFTLQKKEKISKEDWIDGTFRKKLEPSYYKTGKIKKQKYISTYFSIISSKEDSLIARAYNINSIQSYSDLREGILMENSEILSLMNCHNFKCIFIPNEIFLSQGPYYVISEDEKLFIIYRGRNEEKFKVYPVEEFFDLYYDEVYLF